VRHSAIGTWGIGDRHWGIGSHSASASGMGHWSLVGICCSLLSLLFGVVVGVLKALGLELAASLTPSSLLSASAFGDLGGFGGIWGFGHHHHHHCQHRHIVVNTPSAMYTRFHSKKKKKTKQINVLSM
jgi:hypothetical protein